MLVRDIKMVEIVYEDEIWGDTPRAGSKTIEITRRDLGISDSLKLSKSISVKVEILNNRASKFTEMSSVYTVSDGKIEIVDLPRRHRYRIYIKI